MIARFMFFYKPGVTGNLGVRAQGNRREIPGELSAGGRCGRKGAEQTRGPGASERGGVRETRVRGERLTCGAQLAETERVSGRRAGASGVRAAALAGGVRREGGGGDAVASGLSGDLGHGERSGVASWAEVRVLGRHRGRERGEGSGPGFGLGRDLGLSWVLGSFSISFSFSFANSPKLV